MCEVSRCGVLGGRDITDTADNYAMSDARDMVHLRRIINTRRTKGGASLGWLEKTITVGVN